LELHPLDILIHCINILVTYVLLRMLLFRPVRKFMLARTERIEKQLQSAEAAEKEALASKERYALKMAESEAQARQLMAENAKRASDTAEAILQKARQEADELLKNARCKAEAERAHTLEGMQGQMADVAVDIAGHILKRRMTPEENSALIDDFFKKAE